MLSWVVKVVPQLPEPPPKKSDDQKEEKAAAAPPPEAAPPPAKPPPPVQEKKVTFQDECKPEAAKTDKPKQEAAEGNGPAPVSQPGVLTWISGALPQPAVSPTLNRANSTSKEENTTASKPEDEKGMIAWIAQGLEKVVPQPDLKVKESPAEPPTEVCPAAAAPAAEAQVTVVEVESDREDSKPFPPRMMDWIKQGIEKVVPQPEIYVRSKTEVSEKTEAPASAKAEAPAPEAPPAPKPSADTEKSSKETEQQPNVVNWIISGFGRMLPQPVQKQDAGGDEVENISIVQRKTDLVLEDIEQDKDMETKKEVKEETEDAETQMDQWTPLMEDIKKEAGEKVLAHMEERLQQERLEAARIAEEMARKAAEEAVRQLEVEHSAKIVIETLPESNEQLPNILEEENEDDPELQNLQDDSDDSTDNNPEEKTEGNKKPAVEEEKKPDQ